MVEKSPEAYRTIGEASKEVGEPSYVLRFWETKFKQIKLKSSIATDLNISSSEKSNKGEILKKLYEILETLS